MKTARFTPSASGKSTRLTASNSRFRLDPLEQRTLLSASSLAVLVDALVVQDETLAQAQATLTADDAVSAYATTATQTPSTNDATSVLDVGAGLQQAQGSVVMAGGASVVGSVFMDVPVDGATTGLSIAFDEAWSKVRQALAVQPVDAWFGFFPGTEATLTADWSARATAAVNLVGTDPLPWHLVAVPGSVLGQAYAAFAVQGEAGEPTILVNQDRISSLTSQRDLVAVLVEEIGHGIDYLMNGEHDSPGDEGELFAAHIMGAALTADARARILTEDDSTQIQWQGRSVRVEQSLTVSSTTTDSNGRYMADDTVIVSGNATVTTSGAGLMVGITPNFSTLDGNNGTDSLTLKTHGNVVINSLVGSVDPLNGLTITTDATVYPTNVTFASSITLDGSLDITSSGTVRFSGDVTLLSGSLTIRGASNIIFEGSVNVAGGNITLEGDEIDLSASRIFRSVGATLTLRPTTVNLDIDVGDPYAQTQLNRLNLTNAELNSIANGQFAKVIIGSVGGDGHAAATSGTVRFGGNQTANQFTFESALDVYAGSIRVEDIQGNTGVGGAAFIVGGALKLDAHNDIVLYNAVDAKTVSGGVETFKAVTLYAATGAIQQLNQISNLGGDGVSSEPLRGSTLNARAMTGITLFATEFSTVTLLNEGATGNITLQETANGAALSVLSALQSSASAVGSIDISTLGGDLTVDATGAGVRSASATTASITLRAKANLVLNQSLSALDTIKLVAVDGNISQAASQSITATRLLLQAATGAGTSAHSLQTQVQQLRALVTTSGGLFIDEQDGLVLDAKQSSDVASPVDAWDLMGTEFALKVAGNLALHVLNGTLSANGTIQALAVSGVAAQAGNVRLQTSKALVSPAASSVLTVNAALTAEGHVSVLSESDVVLTAIGDISLTTAGKTLDIEASTGALTMQLSGTDEAVIQTNAGNVRLSAATAAKNVTLGQVDTRSAVDRAASQLNGQATWGSVSVIAGGSVLDTADSGVTDATDIYAANLRLNAGAGVGVLGATPNVLEIEASKLSAVSLAGVVGVTDSSALEVGQVAAFSWNRVQADGSSAAGTADPVQSGISAANGSVAVTAVGALSVTQAIALTGTSSLGNLLLQGADTGVGVTAAMATAGGSVSVVAAAGDVTLGATGDITITGNGTVDIQATAGAVVMQLSGTNEAVIQTDAGNVRLSAATAAKNVTVGQIDTRSAAERTTPALTNQATWGAVSVIAGGSVLDADSNGATDIYASNLRLNAGVGVGVLGTTPNALEVEVQTLSAAAAAGAVGVADVSGLEVGTTAAISLSRVKADGTMDTTVLTDTAQSGVSAANGSVAITAAGALSVTQAVALTGTTTVGNVLLQGAGAGVSVTAGVSTAGGSVSLVATVGDVTLGATGDITVAGNGTVDVQAAQAVTMVNAGVSGSNNETLITTSGNVSVKATAGNVTLGQITSSAGKVAIQAGGSVVDGDSAIDVTALGLAVSTGSAGAVGSSSDALDTAVGTLSLSVGSGGAFISESNGLDTGNVSVVVNRVGTSGVATAQTAVATNGAGVQSTGALAVDVLAGDLAVKDGSTTVGIQASGNLRLSTAGAVSVQSSVTSAGNLSVVATAGDVTLAAAGDITLSTAGKSVDIEATAGAVVMQLSGTNEAVIQTDAGNVRLSAATAAKNVTVGQIDTRSAANRSASALTNQATWGAVSVTAGGSVLDADSNGATDIYASNLRMNAGAGVGVLGTTPNALEVEVQTLSAAAAAGAVGVADVSGLEVGTTAAISLSRVKADGTMDTTVLTDSAQSGVSAANGSVAITATGALSVNQAVTLTGTTTVGNVLLQGAGAGVSVTAGVSTAGGSVSLVATAGDVTLGATGDITVAGSGTVDVQATAGAVTMQVSGSDESVIQTNAGNVRVSAATAAKNVTVGQIDTRSAADRTASALTGQATWGAVSVTAGGSVLDADSNGATDIYASNLRMNAGAGVGVLGTTPNALEVEVQTLSAVAAAGAVGVTDASDLTVGTTTAISLSRVKADGTMDTTVLTDAAQSGVSAANGAVAITAAGALSVTQAVALTGTTTLGNVLLQGAGAGVSVTAGVSTAGGSVSLVATVGDVTLGANGDITVAGSGTVDVQATAGAVTMLVNGTDEAVIQTNAGNVRVSAVTAGKNVTVGLIDTRTAANRSASALTNQATWGAVSVTAGGSVLDADSNGATDIYASNLRMNAGAGVGVLGTTPNALEVEVQTLSAAAAAGAVGVTDASDLTVGTTTAISLSRVKADGTMDTTVLTDAAQSGVSAANGSVAITAAGALSVTQAVALTGTTTVGNVLLQGAGAGVSVTAGVSTAGGSVSVVATAGDVTLGATGDITVAGAGTVDVESTTGAVTMQISGADKNVIQSNGGKVRVSAATAGKDVTLGLIDTRTTTDRSTSGITGQGGWGSVSLIAGGAVSDGDTNGATDVYAFALRVKAGTGIGSLASTANPLDLEVLLLSTFSTTGAVAIADASNLALDTVSLSISRVTASGALSQTATADASQGGVSTSNGSVVVVANGQLQLNQSLVAAGTSGSVLLKSTTAGVEVSAASTVAAGSMTVLGGGGDVVFTATGDITLAQAGQGVDVESTTGVVRMSTTFTDKTVIKTNAGNVRVSAAAATKNLTLGLVDARSNADRAAVTLTDQSNWGAVSLISGGSVLDTSTEGATGNAPVDVYASSLRINAGAAVGVLGNSLNVLEVEVDTLSVLAQAGVVGIKAMNSLHIGTVSPVSFSRIQADGTLGVASSDAAQSGVSAANGSVVLTATRDLTVNQAIQLTGTSTLGNLYLQGADAGVTLNAGVSTSGGIVSVVATVGDVTLGSSGGITTTGTGTVEVQATTGAVTMQVNGTNKALIQTDTGNVRLTAATPAKNVTLGLIDTRSATDRAASTLTGQATWGAVSLTAGGSVLDTNDSNATDIYASNLRLNAGEGLGSLGNSANALELEVQKLSAVAGNGAIYVADASALDVGTTSAVSLSRLQTTGLLATPTSDTAQSGASAVNGAVVITAAGTLNVTSGLNTDGGFVSVVSSAGDVNLSAAGDITVTGSGTVDVQAAQAITMVNAGAGGSNNETTITTSGNVSLKASVGNVTLGQIISSAGRVAIQAGGSVIDGDSTLDVSALGLWMSAGSAGAVGSNSDALETSLDTLSISAGSGGIYVKETDGLTIGDVPVTVNRMDANGVLQSQTIATGNKIRTTSVMGLEAGGALLAQDASNSIEATSLVLNVSGDVGSSAQAIMTQLGQLAVHANGSVYLNDSVGLQVSALNLGSAYNVSGIQAGGSLVLQVSSQATHDLQINAALQASGDVRLSTTGSVLSGQVGAVDVTASGLYLTTGNAGGAGSVNHFLETQVNSLSVSAGSGGAYINEADSLIIDGVLSASNGGALDVRLKTGNLLLKAGSQVLTTGNGTITLKSDQGSISQEQGGQVRSDSGAVQVTALQKAQMSSVSSVNGDVGVSSTQGAFELPAVAAGEVVDYGGKPVRIKGLDVQIDAPVVSAGGTFEVTLPGQTARLDSIDSTNSVTVTTVAAGTVVDPTRPFVLGDFLTSSNAPTTNLVHLDRAEVGLIGSKSQTEALQLKEIIVGSQAPGQGIWLQSDSSANSNPLVFNAPLVLVASGLLVNGTETIGSYVKVIGDIQGRGLTIYGSGSTVTYDGATVSEDGDITIYDSVLVNQNTTLTAVGGNITINGRITVKPGVTLTLVADSGTVTLGSGVFNGVTRSGVELQNDTASTTDMATLNIRANHLALAAGVTLDGTQAGQLVLHGGVMDSANSAELTVLAMAMVDNSFAALTLGDAERSTTLANDSLLNEHVKAVTVFGTQVNLDDISAGTARWNINSDQFTVQASGSSAGARDVLIDVNLVSATATSMSLSSATGQVAMTAGAKLNTVGGNLALRAAGDVLVSELNASTTVAMSVGGVALDSTSGTIRAASSTTGMVSAKTVSLYGNGPNVNDIGTQKAVVVQAQLMQVSAPSGSVVRDVNASGEIFYTLIKRNAYFREATIVGSAPSQVVAAKTQVTGLLEQVVHKIEAGYSSYVALRNAAALNPTVNVVTTSPLNASNAIAGAMWVPSVASPSMASAQANEVNSSDLLSDLSYGMRTTASNPVPSDVQINSPMTWSTGLPIANNRLLLEVNPS